MMNKLNEREKAYEDKFAHDEEIHFKTRAKRNKLAGLWAAGLMGKSEAEANAYALDLVIHFLEREALYNRLKADLSAANVSLSEAELVDKLVEFVIISRKIVVGE